MRRLPALLLVPAVAGSWTIPATSVAQKRGIDLYYDYLTRALYRETADGKLVRMGKLAGIPRDEPVSFHVLNVNTVKNDVCVNPTVVVLYNQAPSAFSLAGISSSLFPSPANFLGLKSKAAGPSIAEQITSLQTSLSTLNAQVSGFNEVSQLDQALESMAAYGDEPEPAAPGADPRTSQTEAWQSMCGKMKAYLASLFASTRDTAVQQKGALIAVGDAAPAPEDLENLTESKANEIKQTFTVMEQSYFQIKSQLATATTASPAVSSKSTGETAAPEDTPVQSTPAVQALVQRLDLAYAQAQQSVLSIDAQEPTRQQHLQNAAKLYKQYTSQNFYQHDEEATAISRGDEVVFQVQIVDRKLPLPPRGATQALNGNAAASLALATNTVTVSKGAGGTSNKKQQTTTNSSVTGTQPSSGSKPKKQGGQAGPNPLQTDQGSKDVSGHGGTASDQPVPINVPVYITGRLKIDFSSGFMMSNLADRNYVAALQKSSGSSNSGTKSYQVTGGSKNQISPLVGALAHVYLTSTSDFIPAFSFGLGQVLNGGTQYFVGGSILSGHDQRFVLSGGLSFAQVQRLNGYKLGEIVQSSSGTPTLTTGVFRTGYFLGLTFNFH